MTAVQSTSDAFLPRAPRQIHDVGHRIKSQIKPLDPVKDLLMLQASEDRHTGYIRQVIFTHDNSTMVQYLKEQTNFLRGFVHDYANQESTIIYADCTFNLSNYFALITSVKCDLFVGEPLLLGPVLLTKRQRTEDYSILWKALAESFSDVAGNEDIICVTDGEEASMQAIREHFPTATLLLCSQHLADNVKRKASEVGLPAQLTSIVMKDMKEQYSFH